MRFGAWLACWPLLGVMWFAATVGDSMDQLFYTLDRTTDALLDYAERDDDQPPQGGAPA